MELGFGCFGSPAIHCHLWLYFPALQQALVCLGGKNSKASDRINYSGGGLIKALLNNPFH
jgi:hypothetical protein